MTGFRSQALAFGGRLSVAAIVLASAAPLAAQSAAQENQAARQVPPSPAATNPQNDQGRDSATGEIIVTARRNEERLQRVPGAVSAFNARALDRLQATDTTGLEGAVPNLNIVQGRGSSNATNIFIRGIGQPDALQTFDPAVGVYVDDVYFSRIRGSQLDLLDVDRIEVLRGPQGTLYGKNTIGGAIKFISRRPGQDFRADASLDVGNYGTLNAKASVAGPLSSTVAASIAVLHSAHEGYVRDSVLDRRYDDKNTNGVRGILAFTPSQSVRLDLIADYSHDDAEMNVGRPINNLVTFSGTVLPVDDPTTPYHWKGRTSPGFPNSTKLTHYGVSANATIDLTPALSFKSITAYRRLHTIDYIDIDATQYSIGDALVNVRQRQFTQEFQLLYNTERLKAVAGLFYLDEHLPSHQEAYANDLLGPLFGNPTFTRTIDDKLRTRSYAAFANASYAIVPNFHLSAGIRYTRETKDYYRTTSTFSSFALLNGTYVFAPPRGKWHDFSPMASLDWQVSPTTMVYARVAKGFKSGGFNGRANSVAESTKYDPETAWSYEAGVKTTIANQLRLSADIFTTDYKDFQARVSGLDTDPVTGIPSPKLSVLNAGKLRIPGAELEASWTPVDRLLIDGELGYLDAKYKTFKDVRFTAFGGSRAFQTPAFAPKWTARLGIQYGFDLGAGGAITIGGQTRYKSRTALAVDNTFINTSTEIAGLFQNAYWVEDARIVYETASKHWSIGVYGQNLTNKAYKTDAQEFSSVGNIRTVYYGAPRTVFLRITVHY